MFSDTSRNQWAKLSPILHGATVYADDPFCQLIKWGYPGMLYENINNIKPLNSSSPNTITKHESQNLVFLVSTHLGENHHAITSILSSFLYSHVSIITSISEPLQLKNFIPGFPFNERFFEAVENELTSLLYSTMQSFGFSFDCSVNVTYSPLNFLPVNDTFAILPQPNLFPKTIHYNTTEQEINEFATKVSTLLDSLNMNDMIFAMGGTSKKVAGKLINSARNKSQRNVAVIMVDRSLDLIEPAKTGECFFDALYSQSKRDSLDGMDIENNSLLDFPYGLWDKSIQEVKKMANLNEIQENFVKSLDAGNGSRVEKSILLSLSFDDPSSAVDAILDWMNKDKSRQVIPLFFLFYSFIGNKQFDSINESRLKDGLLDFLGGGKYRSGDTHEKVEPSGWDDEFDIDLDDELAQILNEDPPESIPSDLTERIDKFFDILNHIKNVRSNVVNFSVLQDKDTQQYEPLIAKIVRDILKPRTTEAFETDDFTHVPRRSEGADDLDLFSGFSRLMSSLVKPHPSQYRTVLIIVLGGITFGEMKIAKEIIKNEGNHEMELLFASNDIITSQTLAEKFKIL